MKKILSMILVFAIMLSLPVVSFADGTWKCSNGHENPDSSLFCGKCGEKKPDVIMWICSNGHENPTENSFCSQCGEKKAADAKTVSASQKESAYNEAVDFIEAGEYVKAFNIFSTLGDYRDSEKRLADIKEQYPPILLYLAQAGSYVSFGSYEQDNNLDNGKEDIEWLVLAKEDNRLFVMSKYALDCQPFNTKKENINWENCSLRKWLNSNFFENAFSSTEQAMIPTVTICDDPYSARPNITEDRVFLASNSEILQYLPTEGDRKCVPSDYAIKQGTYASESNTKDNEATCYWFTRSPGYYPNGAMFVCDDGTRLDGDDATYDGGGVRPSLWIDLDGEPSEKSRTNSSRVGTTIFFGTYEQDNNTSNGKEEIEWIVLAEEAEKSLVISKYALDRQPFNDTLADVSWETCSLRRWLNEVFLNEAFSSEEQARISTTLVTADKNPGVSTDPGNNTEDRIFLLSSPEIYKYFSSGITRLCFPTEFTIKERGAATLKGSTDVDKEGTCIWWLRSPGGSLSSAATEANNPDSKADVNSDFISVRPAMWINLEPAQS